MIFRFLKILWPLFIVQFFTWLGLFSLWIYTTPVVTRYVFNSQEGAGASYQKGITWVGFCFAFYSLLAGFAGFLVPKLTRLVGKYPFHAFSLSMGSIGLFLLSRLTSPIPFLLSFAFIGLAWCSIGNVPYAILGEIAPESELEVEHLYLVFNFSIIIPQVTAAFLLGYLTEHPFGGESRYTLLFGSGCMLVAALIMGAITPRKNQALRLHNSPED